MDNSLYFRDEGAGRPIVLLHGFAEDGTVWDHQIYSLRNAARVVVPDLPGSGRSPAAVDPISMESMATEMVHLLDDLGIDKTILVGHSMGGYISLAFAALYPERLHAFGLFNSTAYPDTEEKKATRRKAIGFIRTNGTAPFIRQSTPNLFSPQTRDRRPELVESMIAKYAGFSPDALIAYYDAMIARPDRTAILSGFGGPVFFAAGKDDGVVPMDQALQQCHLPSISHLHVVDAAGHLAMLENPEMSNRILMDFINFVYRS